MEHLFGMLEVSGGGQMARLMKVNSWAKLLLPNFIHSASREQKENTVVTKLQAVLEKWFGGSLGERFEKWEMNRKIARFQKQAGFGAETNFTAEVCQGNFHHHRGWTKEAFEKRLVEIGLLSA